MEGGEKILLIMISLLPYDYGSASVWLQCVALFRRPALDTFPSPQGSDMIFRYQFNNVFSSRSWFHLLSYTSKFLGYWF